MKHQLEMVGSDEVLSILGVSRTTLWRYIKEGTFPTPVKIGKIMRWQRRVVNQWLVDHGADISDWEVTRRRDIEELA